MQINRRNFLAGAAAAGLAALPKTSQADQHTEPVKEEKIKRDVHRAKQNTKKSQPVLPSLAALPKTSRADQKKQKISGIGGNTVGILAAGGGIGLTASAIAMPILTGTPHSKENS